MSKISNTDLDAAMAQLSLMNDENLHEFRSAKNLLRVLCFLDSDNIQEKLIHTGLAALDHGDLPKSTANYLRARDLLVSSGKITVDADSKAVTVCPFASVDAIQNMLPEERGRAFDAAVELLSASWPFLNSNNATDVARLQFVRQNIRHVVALREECVDLEVGGFVPAIGFCALLHEEAWLETMQTNVQDMHFGSWSHGLPMAFRILAYYKTGSRDDPESMDKYEKLVMLQSRFMGATNALIGMNENADKSIQVWIKILMRRLGLYDHIEDIRTLPFVYNETGMMKMRGVIDEFEDALDNFKLACRAVDKEKGLRERELNYMLPYVNTALLFAYYKTDLGIAERILSQLMGKPGQSDDLFENKKSFETGIVIFAMGSVKALARRLPEALGLLRRAVAVLEETHGEDAAFTLAATYRIAVCLFNLCKYEEAMTHLDKLNRAYRNYNRAFDMHDGADFLYQKARVLWKSGRTLHAIGADGTEIEAQGMLDEAMKIRWDVTGLPCQPSQERALDDEDWDHLVNFLYR